MHTHSNIVHFVSFFHSAASEIVYFVLFFLHGIRDYDYIFLAFVKSFEWTLHALKLKWTLDFMIRKLLQVEYFVTFLCDEKENLVKYNFQRIFIKVHIKVHLTYTTKYFFKWFSAFFELQLSFKYSQHSMCNA